MKWRFHAEWVRVCDVWVVWLTSASLIALSTFTSTSPQDFAVYNYGEEPNVFRIVSAILQSDDGFNCSEIPFKGNNKTKK